MISVLSFLFSSLTYFFALDGFAAILLFILIIYLPFSLIKKRRL